MDEFGNCKLFGRYLIFYKILSTTATETDQIASIVTEVSWYYQQMIFFPSQTSTTIYLLYALEIYLRTLCLCTSRNLSWIWIW